MKKNKDCAAGIEPGFVTAKPTKVTVLHPVYPPAPIIDDGVVRLGGQAPMFAQHDVAGKGPVALGGQAPMLLPSEISDAGLVRLGGQSPTY